MPHTVFIVQSYFQHLQSILYLRFDIVRPPFARVAEACTYIGEIILYELMPEMDMSHDAVSDGIFFIECVKIRSADKCIEVVKKTVGHGDGISPVCDYVSHQDNVSSSRFFHVFIDFIGKDPG